MKGKKNIEKLGTYEQAECKFFSPIFPVGFEDVYLSKVNSEFIHNTNDNYMLFVLSGGISLSYSKYQNKLFQSGDMFFFPKNMEFRGLVIEPTHLALLKYNNIKFPCMEDGIQRLLKKKNEGHYEWGKIRIKDELRQAVEQLIHYRESGLSCSHIYLMKAQEIYLIFKHFYTDEERIPVFYPFIGQNPIFAEAVMTNYTLVKTAEELAERLGYGIKTFRDLFKINFGETPYKWMQQQIAHQIEVKLVKKEIPLKQIMFEHKFSTTSHFTTFCRKHLGGTPMEIRNGKISNEIALMKKNR